MITTLTRLPNETHVQVDFDGDIGYQIGVKSNVFYNEPSKEGFVYIYDENSVLPNRDATFLRLKIDTIVGRPSDDPKEVAEWLSETYFFDDTPQQIQDLEATAFKITYFEVIDISAGTSGTITPPTGATIQTDQFGDSGNAVLSTLTGSNTPTFETPEDGGGSPITTSLDPNTGDYTASDTFAQPVALIYSFSIALGDIDGIDLTRAIDFYQVTPTTELHSELVLDDGPNPHGTEAEDIPVTPTGNLTSTEAQAALEELQADIDTINTSNVQSVTGPDVDNADPQNPVVNRTNATNIPDFDIEVSNNLDVLANTAKVSADGSVTTHNDVTDAGSGQIITNAERSQLHDQNTDIALDQGGANEVTAADARSHIDDSGIHVPSGGTTGQVLKKQSNTDGDTDWEDESGGSTFFSPYWEGAYDAGTTEPPLTGTFRTNNNTINDSTEFYLHDFDDLGNNRFALLNRLLRVGAQLILVDPENRANFIDANITSLTDNGTYYTIGVNNVVHGGVVSSLGSFALYIEDSNFPTQFNLTLVTGNGNIGTDEQPVLDLIQTYCTDNGISLFISPLEDASSVAEDYDSQNINRLSDVVWITASVGSGAIGVKPLNGTAAIVSSEMFVADDLSVAIGQSNNGGETQIDIVDFSNPVFRGKYLANGLQTVQTINNMRRSSTLGADVVSLALGTAGQNTLFYLKAGDEGVGGFIAPALRVFSGVGEDYADADGIEVIANTIISSFESVKNIITLP